MVKKLDWLPKIFYVWIIFASVIILYVCAGYMDINKNWLNTVYRGAGETAYKYRHLLEYITGDLLPLTALIAVKKWVVGIRLGYFFIAFLIDNVLVDIYYLIFTNPHEINIEKWQMIGISFIFTLVKFIADGRYNNKSISRVLKITK